MSWCTIESDPVVFNEMIQNFGVKGVEVQEVPVLDAAELGQMGTVYGLVFLFKWKPQKREVNIVDAPDVYFAKQIVTNACATQAIVNILLNCEGTVDLGTDLKDFKAFTDPLPADQRGECMGSHETLRKVHNSFARPQTFTFEESSSSDEDAYHFTAYIPKNGIIYELDGLQSGPILAGDVGQNWLDGAVPLLQERVQQVQSLDAQGNGLMFSLLAVTSPRLEVLQKQLDAAPTEGEKSVISDRIQAILEEQERGRRENVRRRHNYIPLAIACLKALAQKGKLGELSEAAHKTAVEKAAKKAASKGQ
ncbi:Ubiquitin carboxyl-terminal hydrolase 2 [Diplonema papillatum]|nr:Ubiquitin carboxyl-terminal hydrolase 2 [Diplonema papillatum]